MEPGASAECRSFRRLICLCDQIGGVQIVCFAKPSVQEDRRNIERQNRKVGETYVELGFGLMGHKARRHLGVVSVAMT